MSIRFLMHFLVILFFYVQCSKHFYIMWLLLVSIIFPWMWEFRMLILSHKALNPFLIPQTYPGGPKTFTFGERPALSSPALAALHAGREDSPILPFCFYHHRTERPNMWHVKKKSPNKQTNKNNQNQLQEKRCDDFGKCKQNIDKEPLAVPLLASSWPCVLGDRDTQVPVATPQREANELTALELTESTNHTGTLLWTPESWGCGAELLLVARPDTRITCRLWSQPLGRFLSWRPRKWRSDLALGSFVSSSVNWTQ